MGISHLHEGAIDDYDDFQHYNDKIEKELKRLKFYPYQCNSCIEQFISLNQLFDHEFQKHSFDSPYIILDNKIQASKILINNSQKLDKIIFKNCDQIKVEGFKTNEALSIKDFQKIFPLLNNGDFTVTLFNQGHSLKKYYIRVNDIPEEMINSTNKIFIKKFAKEKFTLLEIKDFEDNYKNSLIKKYVGALCDYLRGILFRNDILNKKIANKSKWNELFNRSYSELQFHRNILSDAVVNIIKLSMHDFNDFNLTKTYLVDFLLILLTELKNSGISKERRLPNIENKIPLIPIDDSISDLLEFYENILNRKYISKIYFSSSTLKNERLLIKILFIWQNINSKYTNKDLDYLQNIISLNENNMEFKLFFEKVRHANGK